MRFPALGIHRGAPEGYGPGCCLAEPGGPGGTPCSCREQGAHASPLAVRKTVLPFKVRRAEATASREVQHASASARQVRALLLQACARAGCAGSDTAWEDADFLLEQGDFRDEGLQVFRAERFLTAAHTGARTRSSGHFGLTGNIVLRLLEESGGAALLKERAVCCPSLGRHRGPPRDQPMGLQVAPPAPRGLEVLSELGGKTMHKPRGLGVPKRVLPLK